MKRASLVLRGLVNTAERFTNGGPPSWQSVAAASVVSGETPRPRECDSATERPVSCEFRDHAPRLIGNQRLEPHSMGRLPQSANSTGALAPLSYTSSTHRPKRPEHGGDNQCEADGKQLDHASDCERQGRVLSRGTCD